MILFSKTRYVIILIMIISAIIWGCSNNKKTTEVKIYTDKEFVQLKFPQIEDIKSVKYYYYTTSGEREIGLTNKEFSGLIEIGDDFAKKILKVCKWEKCEVPLNPVLMENIQYNFLYSEDFSNSGKYISASFVGDFYYDKEKKVLYFKGEY